MSTNDYVRFVTAQFVSYMDAPRRSKTKESRVLKRAIYE